MRRFIVYLLVNRILKPFETFQVLILPAFFFRCFNNEIKRERSKGHSKLVVEYTRNPYK